MQTFSFPTSIHFGAGVRKSVPEYLRKNRLRRPLVVMDNALKSLPEPARLLREINSVADTLETFSDFRPNPERPDVRQGVRVFREQDADSIVAIGGGAALDIAKAIALMIHHPGDLFQYIDGDPRAWPIDQSIPHWIALPTTSGTGSEVGRSSVISDERTHVKKIIFSPRLLARAVFADPELTLTVPPSVTAATGMDALTHCVEAYLARGYHPICDGIALEGVRIAAQNLVRCVHDPDDLEARSQMMMASMMGAIAFQKGLGLTHSCAHSLGTVLGLHHGLANGIMIDHALKYNMATVPERFVQLAEAAGLKDRNGPAFLAWLKSIKKDTRIPLGLATLALDGAHLEPLVRHAFEDGCHASNPRVCTEGVFQTIFSEALEC